MEVGLPGAVAPLPSGSQVPTPPVSQSVNSRHLPGGHNGPPMRFRQGPHQSPYRRGGGGGGDSSNYPSMLP